MTEPRSGDDPDVLTMTLTEPRSGDDPDVLTMTLTELESDDWGELPANATGLMTTVYRLRHVPIGELGPGGMRVLLGQRVGVQYVLGPALDLLDLDLMVEDFYPGDLWITVVQRGRQFDEATLDQQSRIDDLVRRARFTTKQLLQALEAYDAG